MADPVTILLNPRSGRGHGPRLASAAQSALDARGVLTRVVDVIASPDEVEPAIKRSRACVVVGGDGTLNRSLHALAEARTPVVHLPAGTENLFARCMRTPRDPATLAAIVVSGRTVPLDLGVCNGRLFALMVSVGADARIAGEVDRTRAGRISRLTYIRAWLALRDRMMRDQFLLRGDGLADTKSDDARPERQSSGVGVVCNLPAYGGRLDPCPMADGSDGLLDAAVIPFDRWWKMAPWAMRARLRRLDRSRNFTRMRGDSFTLTGDEPLAWQLDGEPCDSAARSDRLEIGVVRYALLALAPPP